METDEEKKNRMERQSGEAGGRRAKGNGSKRRRVACATDEIKLWFISPSVKQRRNPSLSLHMCTRIGVHAMIDLLKKPLSICQSS